MISKYFLIIFIILSQSFRLSAQTSDTIIRGDNLITNGDFMSRDPQQRPFRWIMGKGLQTATITSEQKHASWKDDKSLKVEDSSAVNSLLVRSEKRIANPGTKYVANAWVKGLSGTPASLVIEFWDQNDKLVSSKTLTPVFSTEWQEITAIAEAPNKITHVTVSINSQQADIGISYWDDVELSYERPYTFLIKDATRELFLDDYRVESIVDVARIIHPAKKSRPLITPTEPWEGDAVYIYGTVLVDQPKGTGYRMWYTAYSNETYFLCYATSKNGITWKKPDLGIIEYKGSKKNNICKLGGGSLIYDPYDENPERRYKMMDIVQADPVKKTTFGYGVLFSKDGWHWNSYEGNPVISYSDVSQVAYDESKRLFIASTKQRMIASNTSVTLGKMDRAAFISTSKNFTDWTAPDAPGSQWSLAVEGDHIADQIVMAKGGIEAQIYGMSLYPYEGLYIGLPWVFDVTSYKSGVFAPYGDGAIQPQIAVSRDLKHWDQPSREPIIPLGIKGAWDDGAIYSSSKFQQTEKEIHLYYGGMNMAHGGSSKTQVQVAKIAKASWRRDGFVSFSNGGDDIGIITTKAITFTGGKLLVNADIHNSGSLKVEILDASGSPLPGYTLSQSKGISGDHLSAIADWEGGSDLTKLIGRQVKLRFYLDGGDLYSYWFTSK